VEKLNAAGEARVVDLAHAVAREIAERPARLTFRRAPATQAARGPGPGGPSSAPRPYLGSIPDMSSDETNGMRLQGITPGSPADKAGLKGGDVIVEFDGKAVTDLYSYTDALYARKPGDEVQVVVRRGAQRVALTVTLGRRGE
jgi:S1-C subfamily serine protease